MDVLYLLSSGEACSKLFRAMGGLAAFKTLKKPRASNPIQAITEAIRTIYTLMDTKISVEGVLFFRAVALHEKREAITVT